MSNNFFKKLAAAITWSTPSQEQRIATPKTFWQKLRYAMAYDSSYVLIESKTPQKKKSTKKSAAKTSIVKRDETVVDVPILVTIRTHRTMGFGGHSTMLEDMNMSPIK